MLISDLYDTEGALIANVTLSYDMPKLELSITSEQEIQSLVMTEFGDLTSHKTMGESYHFTGCEDSV